MTDKLLLLLLTVAVFTCSWTFGYFVVGPAVTRMRYTNPQLFWKIEPWILPAIFLGVFLIAAFGYR